MKKQDTTNTFEKGMIMDLNPLVTPNNVVTNCLNGTLITYNGNENVLQNDMGNGRVETAYLPEGYVPVGTTEFGGIIYIASYNPFTGKSQIGSFPSPERNFTGDEASLTEDKVEFKEDDFKTNVTITTPIVKKLLGDVVFNPGDKFIVCGNSISKNIDTITYYKNEDLIRQYVNFRIATVDSNGRLLYLDNLRKYPIPVEGAEEVQTIIKEGEIESTNIDIDDYRKVVSADYQIFDSKIAGNLYLVGQLETIDYIQSLTWELINITEVEDESSESLIDLGKGDQKKQYHIQYSFKTVSENNNTLNHIIHRINSTDRIFKKGGLDISSDENPPQDNLGESFDITCVYKVDNQETPYIDVEFIPCMPFGQLTYLKESVHVDFSLLGTQQIVNTIWRYYKEENGMSIKFDLANYNLNKQIDNVRIKFTDLTNTKNPTYYEMPVNRSYNGIHVINIPFGSIINKNSLYEVRIILENDQENYPLKEFIHYMYTNGVFNDYYLDSLRDNNFDNEYLPLEYNINFGNITNALQLANNSFLDKGSSFTNSISSNVSLIKGRTVYKASGSIPVNPRLELKNSFDTFSVLDSSLSVGTTESSDEIKKTLHNISDFDSSIDKDLDREVAELQNQLSEGEQISINLNNNLINYDITLISPISSDVQQREVSVENYYAPALNTVEDGRKFGLNIDVEQENSVPKITLGGVCPAVGMSGGGRDNTGGGGTYYVTGTASAYMRSESESTPKLAILGDPDEDSQDKGSPGIYNFPNDSISTNITKIFGNAGIAPVLLYFVGGYGITVRNRNYHYLGGMGGSSANRKGLFEQEHHPEYITYLLFLRVKESEDYVPIDWVVTVYDTDNTNNPHLLQYVNLLNNLYTKRLFEDRVKVKTVNNISYVNKTVTCNRKFSAEFTYSDNDLKFNNSVLIKLFGKTAPNCAKIQGELNRQVINNVQFTFNIDNKYLDTFLEYKRAETIPSYVRGGEITPPDEFSTSKVYIVDQSSNKLVESSVLNLNQILPDNIFIKTIDQSDSIVTTSYGITQTYKNLDILEYDSRIDTLCIKRGKTTQTTAWKWDNNSNTYICNKYIPIKGQISEVLSNT